ncbi:bifunctional protein GlmU [Propionigenium maris DSM 9537]|uniref:Bifunctional protein GlmU n=1 Tax=Propionigenium maris DSM 9537 TaxID=1123000 RepID=A0A9W6GMY9_9FUSO|nr:bifunctional UDP-N-acetylglucosamine diphosphorylase/glucosamine-1-phosphate N-acetyltransferase GlmU [Propionigenium maris]GLI56532.1 bifunctional protein GlmU [Propionigenium maris DSM 9537]
MKLKTLILAAGKGTRMKSELPKVLHKVNGIPMVKKIMNILESLKSEENILILGHKKELVTETLGDVKYVVQEEQLGTGHAIMMAEDVLKDYDGDVMVVCGDTPLLREETLDKLWEKHRESGAATTVLTSIYEDPFGYGRIVKENGLVKAIVEQKDATPEQAAIKEVNAGVYCFDSKKLFDALGKIDNKNKNGEYYLTDVIGIHVREGEKVESYILEDNVEILGVNSKVELATAARVLRERKNLKLMEEGVILIDPANTYVEESVVVGQDTTLYPGVHLQGETVIGSNCEILGDTRIVDSKIGDDVIIERSVVEESIIDAKVTMGPYAHIRPQSHLKEGVHIGNFVETKKSTLEPGVKAGHLAYLGNAHIGKKTNIGAGTITCNYDGKNKFNTTIGEEAFIGSDTMLVAPVEIGDHALIGAGSVITKDVPARALAVARGKQIIKKEWKKK